MSNYSKIPEKQAIFLIQALNIFPDSKGLDIGCDMGTQLKLIQKVSPDTIGIDKIADKYNLQNFIQKDIFIDDLNLSDLDFAYCLSPYFGEDWWNIDSLFEKIRNLLKNGGLFALDLFNWNTVGIGRKWQTWDEKKDRYLLTDMERSIDKVVGERTILLKNMEKMHKSLVWRVFQEQKVIELAQKFGFVIRRTYSDFDINSDIGSYIPDGKVKRLIIILEKN